MEAVRRHLDGVVVLSTLEQPEDGGPWVRLARDDDGEPREVTSGGTLHWAPLRHGGLRARTAAVSAWIERARPDAMVVDVSAEIAVLTRLHGVPVVLVAQRGIRRDHAHALAYAQASAIAAPWTAETHLPGEGPPDDRLAFTGAVSRFDVATPPEPAPAGGDVLLLVGAGGHRLRADEVLAAARATPERRWHVAGALRAPAAVNVTDHGPRAPVDALLRTCSVVVGTAGSNIVAEVAAARRPFVCLPQERPFQEQDRQAEALRRLGVAVVPADPPRASDWPALLAEAEARPTGLWGALHDGRGAARMAAVIRRVAHDA
jgi:UDP-N-acetylglucosamine:LPS N-acetylglucosamine transferase